MLTIAYSLSLLQQITHDELDQMRRENKSFAVLFYAEWCEHCHDFMPTYERVAKKLDGIASVYKTECSKNRNVLDCYSYDVSGFPTLHIYNPKGTHEKDYIAFNDSRTFYDVMSWITANVRPPFTHVKTGQDMIDQLDSADDFIAMFLPGTKTPSGLYKVANSFTVPCYVETEFTDIDAENF